MKLSKTRTKTKLKQTQIATLYQVHDKNMRMRILVISNIYQIRQERALSPFDTRQAVCPFNPFRTTVPFLGQTTQFSSSLSPKRDCGSKGVNIPWMALLYYVPCRFRYATLLFFFFSFGLSSLILISLCFLSFLYFIECVCRACCMQYYGMALHCPLLCLLHTRYLARGNVQSSLSVA